MIKKSVQFCVDAGNLTILDAKRYGAETTIEVPPGKYKVDVKCGCHRPVDTTVVVETSSGKLYVGDCCYLHNDEMYDKFCEASFNPSPALPEFISFSTGGDGIFRAELEFRPYEP